MGESPPPAPVENGLHGATLEMDCRGPEDLTSKDATMNSIGSRSSSVRTRSSSMSTTKSTTPPHSSSSQSLADQLGISLVESKPRTPPTCFDLRFYVTLEGGIFDMTNGKVM